MRILQSYSKKAESGLKMSRTKRPYNIRKIAPDLIIIVTEGEKTEPNYFRKFPVQKKKVIIIETGMNTISLISANPVNFVTKWNLSTHFFSIDLFWVKLV